MGKKVSSDDLPSQNQVQINHFQYPETKEFLSEIGVPLISWSIYDDEEIPNEASSLIIPGGFPEKYADHISNSKKKLKFVKEIPQKWIYLCRVWRDDDSWRLYKR